jgi:predicted RNA-binding protein with PIN domain
MIMPYLIDGNNLLGSWGGPRGFADGRLEVVRRVADFCRRRGARATIVFDGRPLREDRPLQEIGAVSVRVPPEGADADSVIRSMIDSAARPADWIVVTSDKPLYSYVRTRGAAAVRAQEWNALARQDPAAARGRDEPAAEKPEREPDVEGWLRVFEGSDGSNPRTR